MTNNVTKLVIDNNTITEYEKYYFENHPRATKKPIADPYHPSLNSWIIMKRPMMNALKQRWKDFIVWFVNTQGLSNLHIERCEIKFTTYFKTNRRHDIDNTIPKFILDGMTESGLIIDDNSKHVQRIILECGIDKDNPRTEIEIYTK